MTYKDVNECLMAGVGRPVMEACLTRAQDFAPEKIRGAASFYEDLCAEWLGGELEMGLKLPFEFPFRFRPGETTVWTGETGGGKTTLLDFCMITIMAQSERMLVASMELLARKSLKKMSRQAWGGLLYDHRKAKEWERGFETAQYEDAKAREGAARDLKARLQRYEEECRGDIRRVSNWFDGKLWLYDHAGILPWRTFLNDARWARRRLGITQRVFDNFMRAGIMKDDYAQQADAMTAFASEDLELGTHTHVVVHSKKNDGKGRRGGDGGRSQDVGGAQDIIGNASNIIEVWRNADKAQKMSKLWNEKELGLTAGEEFDKELKALQMMPDGKFILRKQRNGVLQDGSKMLWFMWESEQYCDHPPGHKKHQPIKFVEDEPSANGGGELPTNEELGV